MLKLLIRFQGVEVGFGAANDGSGHTGQRCNLQAIALVRGAGFDGVQENQLFLGTMGCCMHEMVNTTGILTDGDADEDAYLMWRNANGDFCTCVCI